ncbi:ANKRD17, partial [Symbiodinium necroappetens]
MLHVWRTSGQELVAVGAEDFKDVATLKGHLFEVCGFPVYLQQLLHAGSILDDDTRLAAPMDLQLVLLTFSGLSSRSTLASAEEDLEEAAKQNDVSTLRCLLEAGLLRDGKRAYVVRSLLLASLKGFWEVAGLLLQAGASPNCQCYFGCYEGMTALMLASENGHLEVARMLLEAKATIMHACTEFGRTALMLASSAGHSEVVRLLLEADADKDRADSAGRTALMLACWCDRLEVAHLLLEVGACKDCRDRHGNTALILASESGYSEVARLLVEAG